MSPWRALVRGLRALIHPARADGEIDEEVRHYLAEAMAMHVARGLSPEDARRAARVEVGSRASVREQVRSSGWEHAAETLLADIRYAARGLRVAPGFTAITGLTLALGLGGATTIFSAVNPVLFEPLPYPESRRITMIREVGADGAFIDGTFGMYRELASRAQTFESIAVYRSWQPTMTGPAEPQRFEGQRVSASFFDVLGVAPAFGRAFRPEDDRAGAPDVVILADGLWRSRFGADPAIIGRTITLEDRSTLVIGVMPGDFSSVLAPGAQIWTPLQYDMSQGRAWGHHLRTIGRLGPGASLTQATRELNALGALVLIEQRPATYGPEVTFRAIPLADDLTRGVRAALLAILAAVGLVLVIACVNVTNLLLARDARRAGEFALRAALGAGRGRLVRQLVVESLLLAALGGLAGMAVAALGVRAVVALSPAGLPRVEEIAVDGTVFLFALGIATLVGLAIAAIPALHAARSDPHAALQRGSRRTAHGHHTARSALVVAEVALALVLLVCAGLLLRSLERLFAVETGFDPENLVTMQVQTAGSRFDSDSATDRFFERVLEAVRQVPGVSAAGFTSQLPLSGDDELYGVRFDPPLPDDPGELRGTFRYAVSPGYLEAMRIPLRSGRLLTERDDANSPPVALISEALARRRLPGRDPLGVRLRIGAGALYTVVGVVGDVRQLSLELSESEAVYVTPAQWSSTDAAMSLVVRGRGDAAALIGALRPAIWSVDKDQPIVRVATMSDLVAASASERRFARIVFQVFALAALLLAAAGIYGVISGSVAERMREIGVRAALGATRADILAMVVRQGLALASLGVAAGAALAWAATGLIATLLYGVSRVDAATYLGVMALLLMVALVACAVPAWRAARIDPATALRTE
ncbi:MAG TPA: ABC transporter permease [Gemmatimonadaceae bacterium]|nr:ABC transporter permease [Gemmatimonadaceae bacterium]